MQICSPYQQLRMGGMGVSDPMSFIGMRFEASQSGSNVIEWEKMRSSQWQTTVIYFLELIVRGE